MTTLALTDHDAIAGVAEAAEAAERLGIELVPAIEMSCVHEYAEDLHICGYWIDLAKIAAACERAQHERVTRAGEIVEKLRGEGFDLHLEDAVREAGDALSIGRPHIARAAGATGDLGPFFEEYLVPGAKAFVPRRWPTAEQAIELIHEAGGVAVIAHPYWDISEPDEVDDLIRSLGADGVETFYPTHSKEQTDHLLELCDELDLVPTGLLRLPRPDPQDLLRSSAPTTPTASASPRSRQSRSRGGSGPLPERGPEVALEYHGEKVRAVRSYRAPWERCTASRKLRGVGARTSFRARESRDRGCSHGRQLREDWRRGGDPSRTLKSGPEGLLGPGKGTRALLR